MPAKHETLGPKRFVIPQSEIPDITALNSSSLKSCFYRFCCCGRKKTAWLVSVQLSSEKTQDFLFFFKAPQPESRWLFKTVAPFEEVLESRL